jgi:hypothetical protein
MHFVGLSFIIRNICEEVRLPSGQQTPFATCGSVNRVASGANKTQNTATLADHADLTTCRDEKAGNHVSALLFANTV